MKKIFFVAFFVVFFDQCLKFWIKTSFVLGEELRIFDWFILHFTENNGMAFGMEFGGYAGKKILTILRIVIVALGIYYVSKMNISKLSFGALASVGLILGGAIGNIIDSCFYGLIFSDSYLKVASLFPSGGGYAELFHGKVVDMFYLPIIKTQVWDWVPFLGGKGFVFFQPVFNVADSAISIGVVLLILFFKKQFD